MDSKGPAVVDSYAPNPFGLYQVHGNVFEWTEDCFNKRYNEDTPADGSPWLEGDCHRRMLRGGTWDWMANMVRAGSRERDRRRRRPQLSRGADAERTAVMPLHALGVPHNGGLSAEGCNLKQIPARRRFDDGLAFGSAVNSGRR